MIFNIAQKVFKKIFNGIKNYKLEDNKNDKIYYKL